MDRRHVSFGTIPIPIGSIANHNAGGLRGRAFGNGTAVSRGVLNNIKLIRKCRAC
jgi:hypothetical protein